MGQKVSPTGFRLVTRKRWRSTWYANAKDFGDLLEDDRIIREYVAKKSFASHVSDLLIRRTSGKVEVTIRTSRPGLVIGKKGAEIEILKAELRALTKGQDVWVEVEEIKRPDLDAKLVGENIARQLERRVSFRRAMKKALQATMDAGAAGIKIQVSGRLGGAEIARTEWYKEGSIPLHTLRSNIDYNTARAETTYGSIGIKVWVNLGEESN